MYDYNTAAFHDCFVRLATEAVRSREAKLARARAGEGASRSGESAVSGLTPVSAVSSVSSIERQSEGVPGIRKDHDPGAITAFQPARHARLAPWTH